MLSTLLFNLPQLHAQAPFRKIETAPGQIEWMTENEVLSLSERNHELGRCGGFFDLTDQGESAMRTLAVIPLVDFDQRQIHSRSMVQSYISQVDSVRIRDFVEYFSSQYQNRYAYNALGAAASQDLEKTLRSLVAARTDWKVDSIVHPKFQQRSIRVTIPGRALKDQIIVLGAHLDSINAREAKASVGEQMHAPGADDNASGVGVLLEALRILAQSGYQPLRTIEFFFYAGEELGLVGSQQIALDYQKQSRSVVAVLQYDMTSFTGPSRTISFVSDFISPPLTRFTARLVDEYVGLRFNEVPCGHACSDHASWTRAGYASVYPFESISDGVNEAIHTEFDQADRLDWSFGAEYSRLAIAFAVELSERE